MMASTVSYGMGMMIDGNPSHHGWSSESEVFVRSRTRFGFLPLSISSRHNDTWSVECRTNLRLSIDHILKKLSLLNPAHPTSLLNPARRYYYTFYLTTAR